MYSASMANGCGLDSWTCNSECIVATSKTVQGPFTIQAVAVGAFCHNPTAHRTPDGGVMIIHIGSGQYHDGIKPMHCHSGNGSTDIPPADICKKSPAPLASPGPKQQHESLKDYFDHGRFLPGDKINPPNIAYSASPLGPFKPLHNKSQGWGANNPAAHIETDGSVILVSKFGCNSTISPDPKTFCRQFGLFNAPSWNGTYTFVKMLEVFGEDPYIWRSAHGLHMLADLRQYTPALPAFAKSTWNPHHAFSSNDGIDWAINTNTSGLPTKALPLTNGSTLAITRRERPQILFAAAPNSSMHSSTRGARPSTQPSTNEEAAVEEEAAVDVVRVSIPAPLALFHGAALGNTHAQGGDHTSTVLYNVCTVHTVCTVLTIHCTRWGPYSLSTHSPYTPYTAQGGDHTSTVLYNVCTVHTVCTVLTVCTVHTVLTILTVCTVLTIHCTRWGPY
jgi:hypothetical protein